TPLAASERVPSIRLRLWTPRALWRGERSRGWTRDARHASRGSPRSRFLPAPGGGHGAWVGDPHRCDRGPLVERVRVRIARQAGSGDAIARVERSRIARLPGGPDLGRVLSRRVQWALRRDSLGRGGARLGGSI